MGADSLGTPKYKYPPTGTNDPAGFADLGPSADGTPRAATSDFPSSIDSFPKLEDAVNEKVFAQYMHLAFVAIIAVQKQVKNFLSHETVHYHKERHIVYNVGMVNILDVVDEYIPLSTQVFLRGRKLIRGVHYSEIVDGLGKWTKVELALVLPDGIDTGDNVEILYTTEE